MIYLGDFAEDAPVYFAWNTSDSDGASITRSTDGTISVYKDNSDGSSFDTTQVTTGVTNDEDFDGLTGVHTCCITTTNAWYEKNHTYMVVLSASTIDTQVVNVVLAHFSIENRHMIGTDSAALAATALTDTTWTNAKAAFLDASINAIPTTAMRGTDNAALNADKGDWATATGFATATALTTHDGKLDTVDANVDSILTDTGTTLPARFTGLEGSGFLTATDSNEAIRNRGDAEWLTAAGFSTHSAADVKTAVEAAGSKLTLTLEDTAELQGNQANWATAAGFNTVVPDAAGVAPTAAEIRTEMEGAGSKILAIEGDTNELQLNQGNWLTATGFATVNEYDARMTAIQADLDNPAQYKATGFNTTTPPTVAEIRTEMEGVGSKILAIEGDTNELQTNQGDWATATSVTVSDKTEFSLSAAGVTAIWDEVVEGAHTMKKYMRLFAAMLVGKVSGGGSDTITFRDSDDSKNRIVMSVTGDGDRTAVVVEED